MLGVFAEFETNLRKERQMEGIAKARLLASTRAVRRLLTALRCNSPRLKAGDLLRSPASSALPAHPFIGL
jgi:DNA invertase Pin-like site-specific DNA recombinase